MLQKIFYLAIIKNDIFQSKVTVFPKINKNPIKISTDTKIDAKLTEKGTQLPCHPEGHLIDLLLRIQHRYDSQLTEHARTYHRLAHTHHRYAMQAPSAIACVTVDGLDDGHSQIVVDHSK